MSLVKTLSIVVPLFNEEAVAVELVSRLDAQCRNCAEDYEIIIVDDGSTDRSLAALKDALSKFSKLKIIELARNFGQTAALAAGIDAAKGDVIVTMDGDLQHSPEEMPRFLEKLAEGADIVSGWREVRTDGFFLRRLPSLAANALMRRLSGLAIRDFGSTYKAYRAEVLKRIELFGELHRFIPVLASRIGAKIVEIPISVAPREKGASKYGLGRIFGVFEDIIFLEFYFRYLTKPIRAFGRLFILFFGAGFIISTALMTLWLFGFIKAVWSHSALLLFSVFLMTIGVQFLAAGILAELISRIYVHTSANKIYTIRAVHARNNPDN